MLDQSFKIKLHIFPVDIIFIYASDIEACSRIGRVSYNVDLNYDSTYAATTQLAGGNVYIMMPHQSYADDPSILVHETLHATIETLSRVGSRISIDSDEVLCYLQQYIYREITNILKDIK